MSSRIRDNPVNLFDVFLEIAAPVGAKPPWLLWKYPEDYNNEKLLKSVVEFAFPCEMNSEAVQLFSFVFTDADSKYSFGFCRHTPRSNTCLCVLSYLPWFEVFYKLLNHVADIMNNKSPQDLDAILTHAFHQTVPKPGETLVIETSWGKNKLEVLCPDSTKLPRIPDSRNLTEYYNAVDEANMISVFASMLRERRIIFISRRISQLSSCVIAANMLIYPMHWQHIFIPVLPAHLFHYLHAPMPFLIGVHAASMEKAAKEVDMSECVILDIDNKEFTSPYNDFAELPSEVQSVLKKNLKNCNHLLGDGLARSFLRALVALIGNYRAGFHFRPGDPITFDFETYVKSRPAAMESYMIDKMSQLQIFQQFIEERLLILNEGQGLKDEFEEESGLYSGDKELSQFKQQYEIWKREGKDMIKTFRKKVRDRGKEALSDFKGKINSLKDEKPPSPLSTLRSPKSGGKSLRPSSVPSNIVRKFITPSMVVGKKSDKFLNFDLFRPASNEELSVPERSETRSEMNLLEEMADMLHKRSSIEDELENLQKSLDQSQMSETVGSAKGANMRQSISCDDLLQINGGDTNSNGTDFRTELNEIFATRSMMSGSAQSPTLAQANGVSNGQITYEPFPRSNSSATIRSPMPFLPQIPPAVRFPSSHSATDFRRFPFNNAPRLPYRYPQLVTGSGHSSASSLNSSMSLRSLTAQTEAPPPNLLIDLQEQKGPSASNNMTDVIFDPLLDPSRVAAKVAVIEQRSLPAQGKNSSMSPPLPAKPSREMPVIKPLTENFQSNLVAAGQQPVVNRNGWEKFD